MSTKEQIGEIAQQMAPPTTWVGAGTGLVGFLTSSYFIGLVGVLIALAGFCVNWYYRHKEFKLKKAEHEKRMRAIETKPGEL